MEKGISRAIHRKGKMLYRFYCRTALTRLLRSRLLAIASLRDDVAIHFVLKTVMRGQEKEDKAVA